MRLGRTISGILYVTYTVGGKLSCFAFICLVLFGFLRVVPRPRFGEQRPTTARRRSHGGRSFPFPSTAVTFPSLCMYMYNAVE